jgi:hypothetical protein
MVFGRRRKAKMEEAAQPEEVQDYDAADEAGGVPEASGRSVTGPFDVSEVSSKDGYVDLGALPIAPREGLQLRLEVEEATQRVVAVTMDLDGSSLQLQAFAAPRSEGLWDEIREQIGQSVGSQGGQVEEIPGEFGTELVAKLPSGINDGTQGYRVARFIGVDGPRWFLRGMISGPAAESAEAAAPLEEIFRGIVVVRGTDPMPVREQLPLVLPPQAAAQVAAQQAARQQGGAAAPPPPA